jgi:tRNA 2-thiouridine synthesizing protein E
MTDVLVKLCDDNGFLKDWQAWTPDLAEQIAQVEGISLTEAHWEIILLLREYYAAYEASPANRALVNYVKRNQGAEKGNSIYLLSLFPESPARRGSRIAGLPKPKNCL